jgi:hypothetical protein
MRRSIRRVMLVLAAFVIATAGTATAEVSDAVLEHQPVQTRVVTSDYSSTVLEGWWPFTPAPVSSRGSRLSASDVSAPRADGVSHVRRLPKGGPTW